MIRLQRNLCLQFLIREAGGHSNDFIDNRGARYRCHHLRGARSALVHHALNRRGDLAYVVDVLLKNGTLRQRGNGISLNTVPPVGFRQFQQLDRRRADINSISRPLPIFS